MEVLCLILMCGERGRPARSVWRPAKHIFPRLFSATAQNNSFRARLGQIAPPDLLPHPPKLDKCQSISSMSVHECPFQSVKPMPLGKPAEKSMQTTYNKLLANCSRSNQVKPSQSESNQLHEPFEHSFSPLLPHSA